MGLIQLAYIEKQRKISNCFSLPEEQCNGFKEVCDREPSVTLPWQNFLMMPMVKSTQDIAGY